MVPPNVEGVIWWHGKVNDGAVGRGNMFTAEEHPAKLKRSKCGMWAPMKLERRELRDLGSRRDRKTIEHVFSPRIYCNVW